MRIRAMEIEEVQKVSKTSVWDGFKDLKVNVADSLGIWQLSEGIG